QFVCWPCGFPSSFEIESYKDIDLCLVSSLAKSSWDYSPSVIEELPPPVLHLADGRLKKSRTNSETMTSIIMGAATVS
ncbi:hypothetical protein OESDEN_22843, partial [Oesophagostomum dentatum]